MDDAPSTGPGFAIAFLAGILLIAVVTRGEDGETRPLFSVGERSTSTASERGEERNGRESVYISSSQNSTYEPASAAPRLSNDEVERELADAYGDVWDIEEELRELRIWGDVSPYEGSVSLRRGNVRTEDEEAEYLIVEASSRNERAINITDWGVESYVTGKRRWIEEGTRIYRRGSVNTTDPIWLEPGERAYIITGDSPVGVSFHENMCTGYLANHQDFVPSLSRYCPRPEYVMARFADIKLDDDSCWEFVEDMRTCEIPSEEAIENADLSRNCERLLEREFGYNACVDNHRNDPFFDDGDWYIYLDRGSDLWRVEREIIKLTDADRKTVDVIEY